jgi:hypothetical protein
MKKITNVFDFKLFNETLILSKKNSGIELTDLLGNSTSKVITSSQNSTALQVTNANLFYSGLTNNILEYYSLVDKKFNQLVFPEDVDVYPYLNLVSDSKYQIFGSDVNGESKTRVLDTNTNTYSEINLTNLNLSSKVIQDQLFGIINSSSDSEIVNYSIFEDKTIWKIPLSSYGKIIKILGLINNKLWVATSKKQDLIISDNLISLDSATGQIIDIIPIFGSSGITCLINKNKNTILNIYNQLNQTTILEIDGITGQIIREKKMQDLEEKGFTFALSKNVTLYQNLLYITVAKVNTLFGCGIAIIGLNDLKTLWAEKTEDTTGSMNQPLQVNDTHMYALDSGGTLHIYKKIP